MIFMDFGAQKANLSCWSPHARKVYSSKAAFRTSPAGIFSCLIPNCLKEDDLTVCFPESDRVVKCNTCVVVHTCIRSELLTSPWSRPWLGSANQSTSNPPHPEIGMDVDSFQIPDWPCRAPLNIVSSWNFSKSHGAVAVKRDKGSCPFRWQCLFDFLLRVRTKTFRPECDSHLQPFLNMGFFCWYDSHSCAVNTSLSDWGTRSHWIHLLDSVFLDSLM